MRFQSVVDGFDLSADLENAWLRPRMSVTADDYGDNLVVKIGTWVLFHKIGNNPQSHSFRHFIGVTRHLELIQEHMSRNQIASIKNASLHPAIQSLDLFDSLSCQLSILMPRPIYKAISMEIDNIVEVSICKVSNAQIQYVRFLLGHRSWQGTEITVLERFCCRLGFST